MNISMRKTFIAAALTAAILPVCGAEETEAPAKDGGIEQHEPPWFEAGFDNDFFTAYVDRHAIANDRAVWQPCVWVDFTRVENFVLEGSVWQNWDLTRRRAADGYTRAMNETDFEIKASITAWTSDDEDYSLTFDISHFWYVYRARDGYSADPSCEEFAFQSTFATPCVDVYGKYYQLYRTETTAYFELGLAKEVGLADAFDSEADILQRLTVGAEWGLGIASGKYLSYLYGLGRGDYDAEEDAFEHDCFKNGVGGTTLRFNLAYEVCDHFTVGTVLAYTAVLNDDICGSYRAVGAPSAYRNLVWGGLQAKLSF